MKLRKLCSIALLVISGSGAVLSAIQLVPYIREEAQSASTYRDLAAFFSGEDVALEDVLDIPSATFNPYGASDGAAVGMDSSEEEALPSDGDANELMEDSTDDAEDDVNEAAEDGTPTRQADPEAASRLQSLHEKNSDCVAWIRIDGTAINYPVMYRPQSKNYYLHRDFYGKKSSSGAPYISEICDPDTSDNVIIYGHHMNSGSMFAALNKYNVYMLAKVNEDDVAEFIEGWTEPTPTPAPTVQIQLPTPAPTPQVITTEPVKEEKSINSYALIGALALVVIGGGWYFKVYKPKQYRTGSENMADKERPDADGSRGEGWGIPCLRKMNHQGPVTDRE